MPYQLCIRDQKEISTMKYHEAKSSLRHALNHQQTISIKKLGLLLRSLNMSLEGNTVDKEIEYLKGEIKKLSKENRRLKRMCKCE